jgi:hypothetical protein
MEARRAVASQSIWAPVPEADALVDRFRVAGDWSRQLGIPAHVTLAGPWPLSLTLPREVLGEVAADARGTRYRLGTVDTLGDAVCLLPADDRPLLRLRERIVAAAGRPDAIDPAWRPHLTICRTRSSATPAAVRDAVGGALPLDCKVGDLCISRLDERGIVAVETL